MINIIMVATTGISVKFVVEAVKVGFSGAEGGVLSIIKNIANNTRQN